LFAGVFGFIFGVFIGMSNENNAPFFFCLMSVFWIFNMYKGKKLPSWFYTGWLGCAAGLCIMFLTPGLYNRLDVSAAFFREFSFGKKMFYHLNHLHSFIKNTLLLPVFNFLALLIFGLDARDKKPFKDYSYLCALSAFACCWALAGILVFAPHTGSRVYYSASLFSALCFMLLLKYWLQAYGFNALRYFTLFALCAALVYVPLYVLPFFDLRRQTAEREKLLEQFKAKKIKTARLPYYLVIRGPSENLTVKYVDPLNAIDGPLYFGTRLYPVLIHPYQYINQEVSQIY
jgi:hypothetical protein